MTNTDTLSEDYIRSIVKNKRKLRVESEQVGEDEDTEKLEQMLLTNLIHHGGIGLSAVQIGVPKAICVVNVKEPIILVNPRIVEERGSVRYVEGCLSFPDDVLNTERSTHVVVEADNYSGQLHFEPDEPNFDQDDEGLLECVAVQHEIDHINGNLFFDRKIKNEPYEKEWDVGRNDRVTIEDRVSGETITAKYKYIKDKIELDGWKIIDVN